MTATFSFNNLKEHFDTNFTGCLVYGEVFFLFIRLSLCRAEFYERKHDAHCEHRKPNCHFGFPP